MQQADALTRLMDEVNEAVRHGDFATLPELAARLTAAEAELQRLTPEGLRCLKAQAERNARTMLAARRGVKAARRRIAEVLAAARGLVTYDRAGHRVESGEGSAHAMRF